MTKRCYYIHYILLCAAWLLCLAVYFPGVGMNDGLNVLYGRLASANQFPIWYCVYVVILGHIGNALGYLQYAVAIYSVIQILITAVLCAGIITWLYRRTSSRILRALVSAYYILSPVLAIYGIAMIKDTVFSAALVAYGILLYELYQSQAAPSRRTQIQCVLVALLIATLRSNGLYIIILCLLIQWLASKPARRLTIVTVLAIIMVTLAGKAITSHYGVRHNASETLGIPIQQVCAVVANSGDITSKELETLGHFIDPEDAAALYTPSSADPVKWSDAFHRQYLNDHVSEFLSLWLRLLPRNLGIYINAYAQQTYWFWAPNQQNGIEMYYTIEVVADNEYLIAFLEENGIHDAPLLTGPVSDVLRSYYQSGWRFPREGVCLWIMILSIIVSTCRRRPLRGTLALYLPEILCWLTIMASTPVSYTFRYVLFYAYAMPIFLLVMILPAKHDRHEQPSA